MLTVQWRTLATVVYYTALLASTCCHLSEGQGQRLAASRRIRKTVNIYRRNGDTTGISAHHQPQLPRSAASPEISEERRRNNRLSLAPTATEGLEQTLQNFGPRHFSHHLQRNHHRQLQQQQQVEHDVPVRQHQPLSRLAIQKTQRQRHEMKWHNLAVGKRSNYLENVIGDTRLQPMDSQHHRTNEQISSLRNNPQSRGKAHNSVSLHHRTSKNKLSSTNDIGFRHDRYHPVNSTASLRFSNKKSSAALASDFIGPAAVVDVYADANDSLAQSGKDNNRYLVHSMTSHPSVTSAATLGNANFRVRRNLARAIVLGQSHSRPSAPNTSSILAALFPDGTSGRSRWIASISRELMTTRSVKDHVGSGLRELLHFVSTQTGNALFEPISTARSYNDAVQSRLTYDDIEDDIRHNNWWHKSMLFSVLFDKHRPINTEVRRGSVAAIHDDESSLSESSPEEGADDDVGGLVIDSSNVFDFETPPPLPRSFPTLADDLLTMTSATKRGFNDVVDLCVAHNCGKKSLGTIDYIRCVRLYRCT